MNQQLTWNQQMKCIRAMLGCTDGELECIGERLLDSYIADVERVYAELQNLGLAKRVD